MASRPPGGGEETTTLFERPPVQLDKGDEIAGARLLDPLVQGQRISAWRARRNDGTPATVHALKKGVHQREVDNFLAGARKLTALARNRPIEGVVDIAAVVPTEQAYLARGGVQGTMKDIGVLGWGVHDTVRFIRKIAHALRELHRLGVMHGCLRPLNVLLDDDLQPRLSDVGMLVLDDSYVGAPSDMKHDYSAFAAREVRLGQKADVRSDVFSVGRLLHFALTGEEPDEPDDDVLALDALEGHPPGLVRIVRRCTMRDPGGRYANIDELLRDLERWQTAGAVGVGHAERRDPEVRSDTGAAPSPARSRPARDSGRPRDSVRPPAPATPRAGRSEASRPGDDGSEQAPRKEAFTTTYRAPAVEPDDVLSPGQARLGGVLGALLIAGTLIFVYVTAVATSLAVVGVLLGAVGLSLAVPVVGQSPLISRVLAALVLAAAVWAIDPVPMVAEVGRRAKLTRGGPADRAAMVQQLAQRGFKDFRRVDLSGLDLGGAKLAAVHFDGSSLRGTRFAGADLSGSTFPEADLAGADFSRADLTGADIGLARDFVESTCDADTRLPEGWACVEARPAAIRHDVLDIGE